MRRALAVVGLIVVAFLGMPAERASSIGYVLYHNVAPAGCPSYVAASYPCKQPSNGGPVCYNASNYSCSPPASQGCTGCSQPPIWAQCVYATCVGARPLRVNGLEALTIKCPAAAPRNRCSIHSASPKAPGK